jgi:phage-related protein
MAAAASNFGTRNRAVSWIRAARKDFQKFPERARRQILTALEIAAAGRKADIAKPLKGIGSGVFEVALKYRGDAWRTVYVVEIDDDIWVIHAFQKKSTVGIKTPKKEIDKIKSRLKALEEALGK